jgi:serine/threonine-protein kinase RsbW
MPAEAMASDLPDAVGGSRPPVWPVAAHSAACGGADASRASGTGTDTGTDTSGDTTGGGGSMTLAVRADPSSVRAALVAAATCLANHGVGPDALGRVELVLAEALNNIVEHALAGRPGSEICLTLRCGLPLWLACELRDDGLPMPGGRLPPGASPLPCGGAAQLPEGGFGWLLIRSLAEDLCYRREGVANVLSFRIRLGPG